MNRDDELGVKRFEAFEGLALFIIIRARDLTYPFTAKVNQKKSQKKDKNSLNGVQYHHCIIVQMFSSSCRYMFTRAILILTFFQKSLFCIFPSFATWFTGFRTVFVFALQPFLPMWVLFFRLQWEFQWENDQNQ